MKSNQDLSECRGPYAAGTLRTSDLDVLREMVSGTPLEATRLAATGLDVDLSLVSSSSFSLTVGRFDFPVHTEGAVDSETVVVAFQLEPGDGSWNGLPLDVNGLWVYGPGGEHDGVGLGSSIPPFATVSLPQDSFGELCAAAGVELNLRRGAWDRRLSLLTPRLAEIAVGSTALAATGLISRKQGESFEKEMIETLIEALRGPVNSEPGLNASAERIVKVCVAASDELGAMPSTADLAEAAGVTDRWVRAAFSKVFGVSPSGFFRARALREAQRRLSSAPPSEGSVTQVAMDLGFWHLGRFSGQYRSFVGELPSKTLSRSPSGDREPQV